MKLCLDFVGGISFFSSSKTLLALINPYSISYTLSEIFALARTRDAGAKAGEALAYRPPLRLPCPEQGSFQKLEVYVLSLEMGC